MIKNYLTKINKYLYDKEILPIIKKASKYSIEEIAERMKPNPLESIQAQRSPFSTTLREIILE